MVTLHCRRCKDSGLVTTWEQILPFNPQSPDQVKALFHALNLKLPKKRGEDRETTEAKYLKRLKKRYPVFGSILDVRKRSKLISDYMWTPGADGTIRTQYGFHPTTWRKSSRSPNLQVITRPDNEVAYEDDLAGMVRETLCAPPGYVLLEADSEGIEAVLVGYDAGSERMIKIAKAGIHGYVMSHVLRQGIDWQLPFTELKKACKYFKKLDYNIYEAIKRCIHGCVTGEHEILTQYGWVKFADYDGKQAIATWDKGAVEFIIPSHLEVHHHDGKMLMLRGQAFSQVVTEDHALPVALQQGGLTTLSAKRVRADQLPTDVRLPVSGYYNTGKLLCTDQQVRLVVALQADGTITSKTAHFVLRKDRKIQRLKQLLSGLEYRERIIGDGRTVIRFPLSYLGNGVRLLRVDKVFSTEVWQLEPSPRSAFIEELPHWDGNIGKTSRTYITSIHDNAVVVQTLAYLAGQQALIRKGYPSEERYSDRPYWRVSFNRRHFVRTAKFDRAQIDYFGKVYCVTVPGHFFFVRHKGEISITGNTNYGLTPYGMADEYEEVFMPREGDPDRTAKGKAERIQGEYFAIMPEVKEWMARIRQQAHTQRYLDNHFGYRHYFYNVFSYDWRRQQYVLGEDAKRCIAFRPQSEGSAIQSEYILAIEERAEAGDPVYQLLSQSLRLLIHDSLVWCIPESEIAPCAQAAADVMNMCFPELGNMRIGVEVKCGTNMREQSVVEVRQVV